MSGRLTVLVQPRCRLCPIKGKGEPGKFAPVKCQPSSLSTLSSYHATPPRHGWCALETSRVTPSPDFCGAMAQALEPDIAAVSPQGSGKLIEWAVCSSGALASLSARSVCSSPPAPFLGKPGISGPNSRRNSPPSTNGPMIFPSPKKNGWRSTKPVATSAPFTGNRPAILSSSGCSRA